MALYACEMFGHFLYSPDLGYEELGALEQDLKNRLTGLLEDLGARHTEYRAYGDAFMAQCLFETMDVSLFQDICARVRGFLTPDVEARFLFVDRESLGSAVFYAVASAWGWRETVLRFPDAASVFQNPEAAPAFSDALRKSRSDAAARFPKAKGAERRVNTAVAREAARTKSGKSQVRREKAGKP